MQLQFQSSSCRCLKAAAREVRNVELTQEVRLSDGMPAIGRILTSRGQIVLRSKEWQGDQITVSGGIMVWIIYAPEDGTSPRCVDTWVPFQLKWDLEDGDHDGVIRVCPMLRFVDSRSISARKVMVRAGVAALGEALTPMQVQIFKPENLPEDIQLLRNTYPVRLQMEAGEKTFLLDEDLQLPVGSVLPERLLAYSALAQMHEKRVAGDKVILRGTCRLHVLYRCNEGKLHAADIEIPIAQYVQLEETYSNDAQADVMTGLTSLELMHNEQMQLRFKCGLVSQYLITDRYLAEVTEDAYSPRREIELQMEQLKLPSLLEQRSEAVQVQQQVPGVNADVVDASFFPDFPRQTRDEDCMTLEFPGQFQLLYYESDGSLQGSTVRWESTLQMMADPESRMSFSLQPGGNVQVISGNDELILSTQMKVDMYARSEETIPMVSAVEAGEMREAEPDRPSLILCRSGEESLWNLAKRSTSTVEDIIRVNRLEGQPKNNQILLIPVP